MGTKGTASGHGGSTVPPRTPPARVGGDGSGAASLCDAGFALLAEEGSYDGIRFLSHAAATAAPDDGPPAPGDLDGTLATFLDCELRDLAAASLTLDRARLTDTALLSCGTPSLSLRGGSWDGVRCTASRLGAMLAMGSVMRTVEFRDCRIDYLNLRGADWRDVTFRGCRIGAFDAADARLTRVAFPGSVIGSLDLRHAVSKDVDLRGCELHAIDGVAHLAGTTMAVEQIADLAAAFAAGLGIRLE